MTAPSSLRIAHVADLQAGGSYAHGDKDAGGVNSRLLDSESAWVGACEHMIEDKVDLVLFAGDAFETAERGPTEEAVFGKGLAKLTKAGIPVRGVIGNHDSPRAVGQEQGLEMFNAYKGGNIWFADGRTDENEKPPVLVEGPEDMIDPSAPRHPAQPLGLPVAIAYLPWFNPAHIAATDEAYRALDMDARNHYLVERIVETLRGLAAQASLKQAPFGTLLVAHGTVSNAAVGKDQESDIFRDAVIPLAELRGMLFRYQAWGHLHRAQELEFRIRFSGSLDRHDYGESKEDKGWWLVTLGEAWEKDTVEWRSSNPRPFLDLELQNPQDWRTEARAFLGANEVDKAIMRIRYTTTPEIHATVDQNGIRAFFREAGVRKLYGPQATILRDATNKAGNNLTEDTGVMDAWLQFAGLQGIDGDDLARLKHYVADAPGVTR